MRSSSTLSTASKCRREFRTSGSSRSGEPRERGTHFRERREAQVFLHQRLLVLPKLQAERGAAISQRLARDLGKRRVALHQAALPGVLELLRAPELRQRGAFAGEAGF